MEALILFHLYPYYQVQRNIGKYDSLVIQLISLEWIYFV